MLALKTSAYTIGAPLRMGLRLLETQSSLFVDSRSSLLMEKNSTHINEFTRSLGIAFQLQDDWLDISGDPSLVGKPILGDLQSGKYTWFSQSLASGDSTERMLFDRYFGVSLSAADISLAQSLLVDTPTALHLQERIKKYTQDAYDILDTLESTSSFAQHTTIINTLRSFVHTMSYRTS
jgi:geranylgeranyl pyrophosphate synthase